MSNPLRGRRAVRQFGNALLRNAAFPSVAQPACKADYNLSYLRRSVYGSLFRAEGLMMRGRGEGDFLKKAPFSPPPRALLSSLKDFRAYRIPVGDRVTRRPVGDGRETGKEWR